MRLPQGPLLPFTPTFSHQVQWVLSPKSLSFTQFPARSVLAPVKFTYFAMVSETHCDMPLSLSWLNYIELSKMCPASLTSGSPAWNVLLPLGVSFAQPVLQICCYLLFCCVLFFLSIIPGWFSPTPTSMQLCTFFCTPLKHPL